jgi:hypothetical protein
MLEYRSIIKAQASLRTPRASPAHPIVSSGSFMQLSLTQAIYSLPDL